MPPNSAAPGDVPELLQRAIALLSAIVTLPVVGLLMVLIKLDSPGPALYRATRCGERGEPFVCYKLRTMRVITRNSPLQPRISAADDPRITRFGRFLRRTKLDELPQLWNVVQGKMRLVGPRPEDPGFIDMTHPLHRAVFMQKPGITGLTQLAFLDEEELLSGTNAEEAYVELLPRKLTLDQDYLSRRSTRLDLLILRETFATLWRKPRLERLMSADEPSA